MEKVTKINDKQDVTINVDTIIKALIHYNEPTGLNLNIEEFMLDYVENKPPKSEFITCIRQLTKVAADGHRNETKNVLRYFLGRAIGSPPAGDDHVIGLIGIHTLTDALHPNFIQTVKELIESGAITTKAGHYYLRHALKGEFLPPFARILTRLGENKSNELYDYITDVLPIGHTSGIDTTFGMLLGILMIREKYQGER